ncbi:MAG TPA: hypothetical protein VD963_08485, partial [Phycisphaerales bacterium]|nr:hypothetical protein [Phycisphaerales bacterium]
MSVRDLPIADESGSPRLAAGDERALDALVAAGWDPAGVPDAERPRADRIAALLGSLDAPAGDADPALEDVVLLRAARLRRAHTRAPAPVPAEPVALSPIDELALEGVVLRGFEAAPGDGRSARHLALLAALDMPLPASQTPPRLVEKTLARVRADVVRQADRFNIASEAGHA